MLDNYEPTVEQKQEFKNGIKTKNDDYDYHGMIQKIANMLYDVENTHRVSFEPQEKYKYNNIEIGGWVKASKIIEYLGLNISQVMFRKLIQIYRENPERYNKKSITGKPMSGFIVGHKMGYRYESKDWKVIKTYLNSLDERKSSLNKQILSAEQQIQGIKKFNLWQATERDFKR